MQRAGEVGSRGVLVGALRVFRGPPGLTAKGRFRRACPENSCQYAKPNLNTAPTNAMTYTTSDAPSRKTIDTADAASANAWRYRSAGTRIYLNPDGLPVAFRRVSRGPSVLTRGTFASPCRIELVTPQTVRPVSRERFEDYRRQCVPLN
jgi:hypothetical protein